LNSIKLDVSELEAPEPLILAIHQLERLPQDGCLHLIHRMAPCKLYDYLTENGFFSETREGERALCEIFICHDSADEVKSHIARRVKDMAPWR